MAIEVVEDTEEVIEIEVATEEVEIEEATEEVEIEVATEEVEIEVATEVEVEEDTVIEMEIGIMMIGIMEDLVMEEDGDQLIFNQDKEVALNSLNSPKVVGELQHQHLLPLN